jgi:hypothetical protein
MSVSIPLVTATSARDILVLYSKKTAFTIEEYADCGLVYKRISNVLEKQNNQDDVKTNDEKDAKSKNATNGKSSKSKTVKLDIADVKFVVSAINVCSLRVPTEVVNYKAIADLLETLSEAVAPTAEPEPDED